MKNALITTIFLLLGNWAVGQETESPQNEVSNFRTRTSKRSFSQERKEKLAHDVYVYAFDKYRGLQICQNIASSGKYPCSIQF